LVLTRRRGERIRIGDDIYIAILDIEGAKVRVGIEAPAELLGLREELIDDEEERGRRHEPE
jgi:carbon storage regulator